MVTSSQRSLRLKKMNWKMAFGQIRQDVCFGRSDKMYVVVGSDQMCVLVGSDKKYVLVRSDQMYVLVRSDQMYVLVRSDQMYVLVGSDRMYVFMFLFYHLIFLSTPFVFRISLMNSVCCVLLACHVVIGCSLFH